MRFRPSSGIDAAGALAPALIGVGLLGRSGAPDADRRLLNWRAAGVFLAGFASLAAIGLWLAISGGIGYSHLPASLLVYGAIAVTAQAGLGHHPHARFGPANVVTTIRAVVTALFAGLLVDAVLAGEASREPSVWFFASIAVFALALDGVDGFLARRSGLSSAFGARYDMEVDALLILLLSVLAFVLGKAGIFVLAIGAMRYAFVAAQAAFPWLGGALPPSFRRKAVCVMQAGVLGVIVTPWVEPPVSNAAAAVTVAFLAWSFLVDIVWLYRHRHAAA